MLLAPAEETGWQWLLINGNGLWRGVLWQCIYSNRCMFCFIGVFFVANVNLNPTVPGSPVYRGPIHCLRTILQKEGIAGIYRGNVAMLLRDVPGYCAYFIPYAMFCDWITPDGSISPNPFSIWVAGGVAGKHLYFLTALAKQEQEGEGSQGRLRGWLKGHRILLKTSRGHGTERPSFPRAGLPGTTAALYDLTNFMEVVLSDLHWAHCQWRGEQTVPASPWIPQGSLPVTLPGIDVNFWVHSPEGSIVKKLSNTSAFFQEPFPGQYVLQWMLWKVDFRQMEFIQTSTKGSLTARCRATRTRA